MNDEQVKLLLNHFEESLNETKQLHKQMNSLTEMFEGFRLKLTEVNESLASVINQIEDPSFQKEFDTSLKSIKEVKKESQHVMDQSLKIKEIQKSIEVSNKALNIELKQWIIDEWALLSEQLRLELKQVVKEIPTETNIVNAEAKRFYLMYRENELKVPFRKLVEQCLEDDDYRQEIAKLVMPVTGMKINDYLEKCWDKVYHQREIGLKFFEVSYLHLQKQNQLNQFEIHYT